MMLSACSNDRPLPEVKITVNGCPTITRCQLPKSAPNDNGQLWTALSESEAAWASCADKVDMIVTCQEKMSEQAKTLTPSSQQGRTVPKSQSR
ncbi:Rz1-like lysis system protein LysC [Rosenbergiella epipactidis]|uniref:Rz1-like lysis system protein LysC n=1 Tax=Rosenbergiella epipactidis TaxID=1544694 RepID=UPI001F4D52B3|nr:Rz1-like lysis system protein LysC [Rosenbergiella epipactidis]